MRGADSSAPRFHLLDENLTNPTPNSPLTTTHHEKHHHNIANLQQRRTVHHANSPRTVHVDRTLGHKLTAYSPQNKDGDSLKAVPVTLPLK